MMARPRKRSRIRDFVGREGGKEGLWGGVGGEREEGLSG